MDGSFVFVIPLFPSRLRAVVTIRHKITQSCHTTRKSDTDDTTLHHIAHA